MSDPALEDHSSSELVAHQEHLAAVEAVLMVAEEPVTAAELAAALKLSEHQVVALLDEIRLDADGEGGGRQRGYELREVAGGYRFYSRLTYADQVSVFILSLIHI